MLDRIAYLSQEATARIAIGSAEEGDRADISAARAEEAGPGPLEVHRDPAGLVDALVEGRVDAAVRGTLSAHETLPLLRDAAGTDRAIDRVALVDLGGRRTFLLTPVGIDEGVDLQERWTLLEGAARLATTLGAIPRVAVMSMGRAEDAERGEAIAVSARECEALRSAAESAGFEAFCAGIQLERAVEDANVVVAPDGVTGNLIFRALHLVAGHDSWGAVALGVTPLVFVDTSREKADYLGAIHLARALASMSANVK
jgi:predicted methyltransferase MtxX (methanogen marker protein 4)